MDVQKAMDIAREYISYVYTGEDVSQVGLEEVLYDHEDGHWLITFGFVRPWDKKNTVAQNFGLKTPRSYKIVHIDNDNGKIIALTDRLLPDVKR